MVTVGSEPKLVHLNVRVSQVLIPPQHELHGTPHPVVQRTFMFEFPQGVVEVDQTDYGHPGRFNPCHARRVPPPLQPRTTQIVVAAEALAALLD
jgi:hypothetical protein